MFKIFKKTKKPLCREVCFFVYEFEEKTHEGRFLITQNKEFSTFGQYVTVTNDEHGPALFEGMILEHELIEDNCGSVVMNFFRVVECSESIFGHKQSKYCRAALNIGEFSGLEGAESVELLKGMKFVFKTHTYT